jgi:hypothetical protein
MIISGSKISLAGKASINPSKITPSIPIRVPNGSKNCEQYDKMLVSLINKFADSHMIMPAGAAAIRALPSTNMLLSRTE